MYDDAVVDNVCVTKRLCVFLNLFMKNCNVYAKLFMRFRTNNCFGDLSLEIWYEAHLL